MNEKDDEHELNKLRMQKMKALIDAKKQQEAVNDRTNGIFEKVDYVLRIVLHPDAYSYLMKLKAEELQIYQAIFNELVSGEVIQNIDYLISILQQRGGIQRRIPLDALIHLERKLKGIKSKILVKRADGDMMDLGSFLKK